MLMREPILGCLSLIIESSNVQVVRLLKYSPGREIDTSAWISPVTKMIRILLYLLFCRTNKYPLRDDGPDVTLMQRLLAEARWRSGGKEEESVCLVAHENKLTTFRSL